MKPLLWVVSGVIVAAGVHWATITAMPGIVMSTLHGRLKDQAGLNTIVHVPRPDADARGVVRPSPDLLYSICAFDLTNGRLTLEAQVPESYWSLALYADNTDNFFVLNDRQVTTPEIRLTVLPPNADNTGDPGAIVAPSTTGIALFRTLVTGEDDLRRLDAIRREARCIGPFIAP